MAFVLPLVLLLGTEYTENDNPEHGLVRAAACSTTHEEATKREAEPASANSPR